MVDPKLMVLLTVGRHHASSWATGCLHSSEPPGLLLLGWSWVLHWTMSSGKAAAGFHAHLSLAVPCLHQDVWLSQLPPCNTPIFSPNGGLSGLWPPNFLCLLSFFRHHCSSAELTCHGSWEGSHTAANGRKKRLPFSSTRWCTHLSS